MNNNFEYDWLAEEDDGSLPVQQDIITWQNGKLYKSDMFGDVYVMTEFNSWMKISE